MPARLHLPVLSICILFAALRLVSAAEILPPGHRPIPVGNHVLTGGKVVTKPGEVLQSGTVIIRDGFITAVGSKHRYDATDRHCLDEEA
jgi:hypothetical protein